MIETIRLVDQFGPFCANGEEAVRFLKERIVPIVSTGLTIVFDCEGIRNMNSSFSNALFANLVIKEGPAVLDRISFLHCSAGTRLFISSALERGIRKAQERLIKQEENKL